MIVALLIAVVAAFLFHSRATAGTKIGLAPLVLLAAGLGYGVYSSGYLPTKAVVTPRPAGPDLVEAFKTNDDRAQAKQHAQAFAAICASLGDVLEYDGKLAAPRIRTGVQVDDLRRWTRENHLAGHSFSAKYPGLKTAVEKHLTDAVGTSGGPLAAEQRNKWVAAYRELAACADYASKQ